MLTNKLKLRLCLSIHSTALPHSDVNLGCGLWICDPAMCISSFADFLKKKLLPLEPRLASLGEGTEFVQSERLDRSSGR